MQSQVELLYVPASIILIVTDLGQSLVGVAVLNPTPVQFFFGSCADKRV